MTTLNCVSGTLGSNTVSAMLCSPIPILLFKDADFLICK